MEKDNQDIKAIVINETIQPAPTTENKEESNTHVDEHVTAPRTKDSIQVTNIPNDENKFAKNANRIAIWGIGVNLVLAILTYLLFLKTIEANQTSSNSLSEAKIANDISQNSLQTSKVNDSISDLRNKESFNLSKLQFENNRIKDSLTQELTKLSLRTQIDAFNDNRKRFEIENRPLVQMTDITIDSILPNKEAVVKYNLVNMGRFPAKMISAKVAILIGTEANAEQVEREAENKK